MQSTIKDTELQFTESSSNLLARYQANGIKFGGADTIGSGEDVMQFDESNLKIMSNSITIGNKNHLQIPVLNDAHGFDIRTITQGFTTPVDCTDGAYTNISPHLTEIGTSGASQTGTGAIFSCQVTGNKVVSITVANSGTGYRVGNKLHINKTAVGSPTADVVITVQKRGQIELNGMVTADSMNVTGDIMIGEKDAQIGHDIVLFAQNTYLDSTYGDLSGQHRAGDIYANGDVVADSFDNTSDRRMKTNIQTMSNDISSRLYNLRPVTYKWKDRSKNQDLKFGLIAQEVENIYPNIVREFSETHLTLDYIQLIAPMVNEIKHLQNRNITISEKLKQVMSLIPVPDPVLPPKQKRNRRKL